MKPWEEIPDETIIHADMSTLRAYYEGDNKGIDYVCRGSIVIDYDHIIYCQLGLSKITYTDEDAEPIRFCYYREIDE